MKIRIEEKSGFCYGVVKVVEMADKILSSGEKLFSLGQIVHNEMEVLRLEKKGLKTISHEEMNALYDCKLLIRAHGEPPSTFETAKRNRIEIIDGTCPIVHNIQLAISSKAAEEDSFIVIFGKKDHPEVEGLIARAPGKTVVIKTPMEVTQLPVYANMHLYSQTTMDTDAFKEIIFLIEKKQKNEGGYLVVHNTICGHVSHRRPGLLKFASENDVVIFLGGTQSSNGKVLFNVCREANPKSYYVSHPDEIMKDWLYDADSVGVAGATSTPRWQIEQVTDKIKELTEDINI
jgi:4-hydroxy-3-methylbut-2-en-1-yl diphosphate reductase